jgi:hypothetical protein
MSDALTFPYLDLTGHDPATVMMLTAEQKWTLVDRLLAQHGHDRNAIPAAWADSPLTAWCWLILVTNNLDHEPNHHHPLTHWGIDLSLAGTALRRWIWAIA